MGTSQRAPSGTRPPAREPIRGLTRPRVPRVPVGDRLERVTRSQQQIFRQLLADQLKANRRATLVETAIHRCTWAAVAVDGSERPLSVDLTR
jgi:hypothetical protein